MTSFEIHIGSLLFGGANKKRWNETVCMLTPSILSEELILQPPIYIRRNSCQTRAPKQVMRSLPRKQMRPFVDHNRSTCFFCSGTFERHHSSDSFLWSMPPQILRLWHERGSIRARRVTKAVGSWQLHVYAVSCPAWRRPSTGVTRSRKAICTLTPGRFLKLIPMHDPRTTLLSKI